MTRPFLLHLAFWVGVAGFVASLAVHLSPLVGADMPEAAMVLHVGVFVAFIPVVFAMKAWAEREGFAFDDVRGQWALNKALIGMIPMWQRVAFAGLIVYVMVVFVVGVLAAIEASTMEADPWLFSGHWLFFYAVSTVYARRFLTLLAPADGPLGT